MEVDVTEKAKNFIRFGLIGLIVLAAWFVPLSAQQPWLCGKRCDGGRQ